MAAQHGVGIHALPRWLLGAGLRAPLWRLTGRAGPRRALESPQDENEKLIGIPRSICGNTKKLSWNTKKRLWNAKKRLWNATKHLRSDASISRKLCLCQNVPLERETFIEIEFEHTPH